jgi:GNAT superfamily N-acetyltransferase
LAPGDKEGISRFLGRLSAQSIRRRFFLPLPRVADDLIGKLVDVDHDRHEALVAIAGDDVIALASYHRAAGESDDLDSRSGAEADVVVQDDWHRHGLGSALLDDLSAIARQRGITHFTATVLAENAPMLALLRKVAPRARRAFQGPEIGVDINLLTGNCQGAPC